MSSKNDSILCLVRSQREQCGMSQAELARRCNISRQAVNVIESGRSVPSVLTAFKIAEALGCSIEAVYPQPRSSVDSSIEVLLPAKVRVVTPRLDVARVRDRWVGFPSDQPANMRQGFHSADALLQSQRPRAMAKPLKPKGEIERNIIVFGCDPGLGLLRDHLSSVTRVGRMLWVNASSQNSLNSLNEGRSHVAGIHFINENGDENIRRARRLHLPDGGQLLRFASWDLGWLVASGNPKSIRSIADLARPDVRFVNRESGSGSRLLVDDLLDKAGLSPKRISGYETLVSSHNEGGEKVCMNQADAAIGLRSVAMVHGLDFCPIAQVGFDLVIPSDLNEHPTIAAMFDSLQSTRFRRELQSLPGYETSQTGHVMAEIPSK
jgi:molybdate-binding protein/DNA-binding XRE family transcriptional regulator